jgi:thioesterase DpgC
MIYLRSGSIFTSRGIEMASSHAADAPAHRQAESRTPPMVSGDYARDSAAFSQYWIEGLRDLDALPAKRERSAAQQAQAESILTDARKSRNQFLARHVGRVYRAITGDLQQLRRVEYLAYAAAEAVPGLCPTKASVAKESAHVQAEKDGHEIDQGIFFNHVLADQTCGLHLCHAMLLPRQEAIENLEKLKRDGRVDFPHASVERRGEATIVTGKNSRYLNAEDDHTVGDVETAVDLALLDPYSKVCVLRGGIIDSGKHKGERIFCSGINLTHIYYGRLSYLWYLIRDLGFINKIYRGLAMPDVPPDDVLGDLIEKPWICAIEQWAIGGGCQYILGADVNIATKGAYLTLPARKEGIIPGIANMRMPRFVGDRVTRQAIMMDRRIDCESPDGRKICDMIVDAADMDRAINDTAHMLANSGVVNASSNRKALRVTQEPLDMFRTYMAVYAREQAYCHFSSALISNLERFWNAKERKL